VPPACDSNLEKRRQLRYLILCIWTPASFPTLLRLWAKTQSIDGLRIFQPAIDTNFSRYVRPAGEFGEAGQFSPGISMGSPGLSHGLCRWIPMAGKLVTGNTRLGGGAATAISGGASCL